MYIKEKEILDITINSEISYMYIQINGVNIKFWRNK